MSVRLRAHNLLCLQGFVGKGYSEAFVATMTRVAERLRADPGAEVTVLAAPDDLCAACPNLAGDGCRLHGPGTERGIEAQDADVSRRLGLEPGRTYRWADLLARIRARVAPADLGAICGRCPWLALGHCAEGLERLRSGRMATPGASPRPGG